MSHGEVGQGRGDAPTDADVPLFIDMDGVLLRTDITVEAIFGLIRARPIHALLAPWWLWRGVAHLKRQVAQRTDLDVTALPYNERVLALLRAEKAQGRRLVLATAADRALGERVASHVGLFDAVLGSDGARDLTGRAKLAAIRALTGGAFDYAGNQIEDAAILREARRAILVNPEPALRRAGGRIANVALVLDDGRQTRSAWLHALRPGDWPINLLVLLPALAAPGALDLAAGARLLVTMAAFALCGSGMAIFDELLNLALRRARGAHSPICDGRVSADRIAPWIALLTGPGLLAGLLVSWQLAVALLVFCGLAGARALGRLPALPGIVVVAALAALRLLGGAVAMGAT